ncbi:MAG: TRAP transporter substrate-binding protein DctP, partial [Alphaproteobacteria bacterium]|nr:TRAP transporter substrate-binding protein DctP [Alphaproteobacteria bacterium]
QMGDLATGPVAAEAPELNVYSIPFVCSSFDGFFKSVAEAAPTVDEVLAKRFGVGGLMHWTMPPQQIWLVQPAGGIDDLKNRKIRTWNKEQVDMLRLLGGQGVAMTAAEVIPALQRKVVDGAITAAIPAMDWKFDEVAKFGYMLNFTLSHQIVGVNLEQLKKLPADLQAIVTGKTREWGAKYRKTIEEGDGSARKALVAKGMTLKDASPADLKKVRDVTRPMWDEWANKNGDVAKKLLATVSKSCA